MEPSWFIAEIIGAIDFPAGRVSKGRCLFSRACDCVNVWLYPSNGLTTLHLNVAKTVLKTVRDAQNKPIKWGGGK